VLKQPSWFGENCALCHYQDKDQDEVDLVIETESGALVSIEVKACATVNAGDFKGSRKLADACGDNVVDGVVDEVKTEYSEDDLPLDPGLAEVLLTWKRKCRNSEEGWIFPSPVTGRCYHASPIQQDYLRPAGRTLNLGDIGWHTFRHTYRSWLDLVGTSMGVQQKLMRHAQIATTMNVYGDSMMESKRAANSKVVEMALRPHLREAK
jgi:Phage integrase family